MTTSAEPRREVGTTAGISWPIGAALFLAAVIVPLFRQTGTHSWDTIWAEDGTIYGGQVLHEGGLSVLVRGYAGYLQGPPRIIGLLTPLVPFRDLAVFYSIAGTTVCALLALFVYRQSAGWIPSPLLRVVLASSVVIGPVMIGENTANITNTIWAFAAVAVWALGSLQDRASSVVARSGVAFLAATSTPLTIVYVPIAIALLAARRTRPTLIVVSSFVLGLVVQGAVVLSTAHQAALGVNSIPDLVDETGVRVFWFLMLGPRLTSKLWASPPMTVALLGTGVVLVLLVLAARAAGPRARLAAIVLTATAVVAFAVPTWGRGTTLLQPGEAVASTQIGQRFSVIPIFLLLSAAMILLGDPARSPTRWAHIARAVLIGQIVLLALINFSGSNGRSYFRDQIPDARWTSLVDIARDKCDGQPSDHEVDIPASFFFTMTVRCEDLTR